MNKELYVTLKIKLATAENFRLFSRQLREQQTESLQLMLDFFKNNGLSPRDDLGPNITTLEKRLKVRINAVIAILRDIEKTQTRPTHSMLQLLFCETPGKKKEVLLERHLQDSPGPTNLQRDLLKSRNTETELKKKLDETTADLRLILEKVTVVRNNFGSTHFRLNLSKEELEALKSKQ